MPERLMQTGQGRVFFQKFASGPGHPYAYLGNARLTGFTQGLGDITPVRNPSQSAYDQFDVVDEVRGDEDLPTTSLIGRFGLVNPILTTKCPFDVQAHYGKCLDPTDFIGGWDKILAFERARFTSRSSEDLTALESGDRAMITLTGEITARMLWEINPLLLAEEAGAEVILHVHDVVIYDTVSCGECGWESEGDQKIYAICESSAGSPGLPPRLLYSDDRGGSWDIHNIPTIAQASGEEPWRIAIVGSYAVVTAIDTDTPGAARGVHHALLTDLSAWTHNVNAAFVSESWAIFSLSATQTWLCGYAGDVYFMDDPTQEPALQGSATSAGGETLLDIHGCDSLNLVAVGEDNTVIYTTNGGKTWAAAVTAPMGAGEDVLTVWVRTPYFWIIGGEGGMWYTKDQGTTWTEITLPVASIVTVESIAFADHTDSPFGYAVVCTAASGYMLRTIDGGNSWYELPEGPGTIPTNHALNAIAAGRDGNYAIAGGVKGTGAVQDDGILISAA
jgi:hypothetical protein